MTPQGTARLKIWLALLGVFALGALTGGALDRVYRLRYGSNQQQPPHKERGGGGPRRDGAERFFQILQTELVLTDEQSNAVRAIIDRTRNEYHTLRNEVRPRYDAIRQRERAEIRALLTADQQQKFNQLTERFDAKHRGRGKHEDQTK